LSADSQRLLAIAAQSWGFGGMGWCGDRIFKDEAVGAERDRVGDALLRACAASVNAPLTGLYTQPDIRVIFSAAADRACSNARRLAEGAALPRSISESGFSV
jgi:hypothetical protein